jgi:hypothetical protein
MRMIAVMMISNLCLPAIETFKRIIANLMPKSKWSLDEGIILQ